MKSSPRIPGPLIAATTALCLINVRPTTNSNTADPLVSNVLPSAKVSSTYAGRTIG